MHRIDARRLAAVLPLATGAGLLGFLLARVSLWLGFAVVGLIGIGLVIGVWRRANPAARADLLARARAGLFAGLIATACYDVARYVLVTAFESSVWPFAAFPAFGGLLMGPAEPYDARLIAGIAFHIVNGVGFTLAYALFVRRPRILTGVLWALVLEALMLTLYPTWLDIKAIGEFTQMSMFGHVVYGIVLGALTRRWVPRPAEEVKSA
ncbi:MAG: DUF6789 family protein [Thermoflexales bacterium]